MANIVFFGNTKYSVIVAQAVHKKLGLALVLTNPDKPAGRGKVLTPNPVKVFALASKIPTITAAKLDKTTIAQITKLKPDFLVLADYGLILPKELLEIPKYAPLNVHHSLLPKYRGPSPAPTAILNGEEFSGVTIIKMNEQVDAGQILAQKEYKLKPEETTDSLLTELNRLGGEIIGPVIESYLKGTVRPIKQDETKATFTQRIKKADGFIELENPPPPDLLNRMIRAYHPWPGVWSKLKVQSEKLKVIKFLPGQKIQVEGGKPMTMKDVLNGYPEAKRWLLKIYPDI
ncbi:MAG: methionyl-tRNA formyltransferase [bacterium]|nr:methionyl-tRNA formyltransferase [bacterium]